MPACELCGKETQLFSAVVEGADLEVCANCAKHGAVKNSLRTSRMSMPSMPLKLELPEETIVHNFASLLHQAREKRGLSQEDFAKLLQERESMVTKWELGSLQPEIAVAKKIGKILGLSLVEMEKAEPLPLQKQRSGVLTLGDMIKVRKRKV